MSRIGTAQDTRDTRDVDRLVERVDALRRFTDLAGPHLGTHLPPDRLAGARAIIGRAGERLALSRAHTVVALAGATGSGKSSIFNALAGRDLSPVGLRRPTTSDAHASVWGPEPAHELLDWLGVGPRHGVGPSTVDSADGLTGLVLVDIPDFDSVQSGHRLEAERLLALVDLVVWVLDPQKYGDRLLHRQYLAQFGQHRDITVVALNQADRLDDAQLGACLSDLGRLLEADGLGGVPTIATSTVGRPGLAPLRALLARAVAARQAALSRLSADVAVATADLWPLVAGPVGSGRAHLDRALDRGLDRGIADDLYRALSGAAGVPLVVRAVEGSYVHQAVRHTGWPVTRWVRRFRADPLGRLGLGGTAVGGAVGSALGAAPGAPGPVAATSIGPAAPAAKAAVGLALRAVGDRAGRDLPEPWPAATLAAARSRLDDLPDALDLAVARTSLGPPRPPGWWRLAGLLQLLLVLAAGAGLAWLVLRYALFALALPTPPTPEVGRLPLFTLLFVGGLAGGLLLGILLRPVVGAAARRRGRRVARSLDTGIRAVGDEYVLTPVARVGHDYRAAREALEQAGR